MLFRPFLVTLFAVLLAAVANGQTTDATCLPYFGWMNNSLKQSPCEVAATLLAVCGPYNVIALPGGNHYTGPPLGSANLCQCNTVVYSLMSACGACQGQTYQTWSTWSGNCPTIAINSFPEPLPKGTFVQGWAYLDVQTNGNFNVTAAKLSANTTVESTAIPTQTSTSTSITTTTSSTLTEAPPPVVTDPSASTPASEASSNSSDNVIMGAIVGGTLGTAALIGFVYWLVSRRRLARSGIASTSPPESILGAPKSPADMQQYLANTVPTLHLAPSSADTSFAGSLKGSDLSNLSVPGSIRSEARSNV